MGPAVWVWDEPEANTQPQTDEPRFFRTKFALAADPLKAELWVTADNEHTSYVNGKKLGRGTEWSKVDKYDVTKLLHKGDDNVLAIRAQNHGGVAGMIARLWIQTADKKDLFIVSGPEMRVGRTNDDKWIDARFADKDWPNAIVLGDAGIGPWNLSTETVAQAPGNKNGHKDVTSDGKIKTRLSAADQLKEFTVPKDFVIELVADEPLIINPVTMVVDDKGRILVSESHTYRFGPSGSPVKPFKNPVVRLEPKADGKGFDRVVVADGFDDPVMGIAVKGNKLWLTANNYLYQFDYPDAGPATGKKTLVVDKNKAWNPFGNFVLEWGPDGLLYMSVGDHKIALEGPTNKVDSRGTSGIIVRMNPDGSNMERLTQGFRVPYSFEMDPFGQLWLCSNGEGNPNRFARIIPGVDYHCYTRGKADNNWLAGNHPLAPPVTELPRGANTQLMRYYGAAYPQYVGDLFLDNWGAHGFHGPNRGIFRWRPDARGNIVEKDCFVSCNDPHFRPSHICLDHDGNMLIADWYGRDDESDMTGRIWRVRSNHAKDDRGVPLLPADASESLLLENLGSISHINRQQAADRLIAKAKPPVPSLRDHAANSKNALGAANALWCLFRISQDPRFDQGAELRIAKERAALNLTAGAVNSDPGVRRLSLDLARRSFATGEKVGADGLARSAVKLLIDPDPAVRLEAALTTNQPAEIVQSLEYGAAKDHHLRYRAAAGLAQKASTQEFTALLASPDPDLRLVGLIAIDIAGYENTPAKKDALAALAKSLTDSKVDDLALPLFLVQQHGEASLLPALEKLLVRDDLNAAVTSKAMIAYRGLAGKLPAVAGKRFLEAVQKGTIALTTPADHLTLLEFLETEGPTPFALEQLGKEVRTNNAQVKPAALALARRFGPKSSPLADSLWPAIFNPKAKADDSLDALATLAVIESPARAEPWTKLLEHADPLVRTDAVRWWRSFKKNPEMIKILVDRAPALAKADADLRDDLSAVFRDLGTAAPEIPADDGKRDHKELAKLATESLSKWSPGDKQKHALLGKQVFERSACTKCHTTVTQNTPLAPSLKGIGGQKLDYLIESILEPSKIIKTGFNSELIITTAGKSISGLVKDEGDYLRIQNADVDVKVLKKDVEERTVQKLSIMPAGQEVQMSRREFVDLVAYLASLK